MFVIYLKTCNFYTFQGKTISGNMNKGLNLLYQHFLCIKSLKKSFKQNNKNFMAATGTIFDRFRPFFPKF